MPFQVKSFFVAGILGVLLGSQLTGCGYTLQTSRNVLFENEAIARIYIAPIGNTTGKGGVEVLVYNSLVKALMAHKMVQMVSSKEDADAVLTGGVSGASYGGGAGTSVSSLTPQPLGDSLALKQYNIWSQYIATLSCSFSLTRTKPHPKKSGVVWSAGFTRTKPFPGANQLDVPGTTSPLINESEFDRALVDLARSMMDDVHESMVAMF
jgi:hypothetical protein